MRTLLETKDFIIELNSSDEIFIRSKFGDGAGVSLRISQYPQGFHITAMGCNISPTSVNGLDAIRVTNWPKR